MRPGSFIKCPFHPEDTPSLYMDDDDSGYCFGCGWHGTIVDVMSAAGYTGADLLFKQTEFLKAAGWSMREARGGVVVRPSDGWEQANPSLLLGTSLAQARWKFIMDRGYTMDTLAAFNTHSWKGIIYGWPVNGDKWVTRWRQDWTETGLKKYLYDPGFSRASLYAQHPAYFNCEIALVTEGVLDVMKIWQATEGKLGVGIFGTLGGPTISQIRQLLGFVRVYEMFDNDKGGDAHRLMLKNHDVQAIRVHYNSGDPGDCSDSDLRIAIREGVKKCSVGLR